ncbi:hypothetical protein D3C81_1963610 [compost metagenome]
MKLQLHNLRIMGQAGIQHLHHLGCCAFLRTKYPGSAMLPAQRVRNITGYNQLHLLQTLIKRGNINACQTSQAAAAAGERRSFFIKESGTECLGHACPAIIGCAPPNPDNDPLDAFVQTFKNQFTRSISGGN